MSEPDPDYDYPPVPTRAQLARLTVDEVERAVLLWIRRHDLKGVGGNRENLRSWIPEGLDEAVARLCAKGALMLRIPDFPEITYLGTVLIGAQDATQHSYQVESTARLAIMWAAALDRADEAGEPVAWSGDHPDGVDQSIPVPEATARVEAVAAWWQTHGKHPDFCDLLVRLAQGGTIGELDRVLLTEYAVSASEPGSTERVGVDDQLDQMNVECVQRLTGSIDIATPRLAARALLASVPGREDA